jgi:hypothetical protein
MAVVGVIDRRDGLEVTATVGVELLLDDRIVGALDLSDGFDVGELDGNFEVGFIDIVGFTVVGAAVGVDTPPDGPQPQLLARGVYPQLQQQKPPVATI